MTINVAIYCRVSTEMQSERGYSLQEQESICQNHATEKNYSVIGVYKDDVSGAKYDREEMNKVIQLAKSKKIERVLVQELDRFAREAAVLFVLEHQLQEYGVEVDYVLNNFQPGAIGNFHKTIAIALAELEREQIKTRTKRGKMGKAKTGKVIASPTAKYGYNYSNGAYLINEEEAQIVRFIFDWYVHEKLGTHAIALRLSDMKIPTKRDKQTLKLKNRKTRPYGVWNNGTIADILKSECYTGKMAFNKTEIVNKKQVLRDSSEWVWVEIPALISTELFEAAQKQMTSNRQYNKRNTKRQYLLSGMLVCGNCGWGFVGFAKPNSPLQYYRCGDQITATRGPVERKGCTTYLRSNELDELIWNNICQILENPDLILQAVQNRKNDSNEKIELITSRKSIIKKELTAIENNEQRLLDLYLDSSLAKDLLESKMEELKKRKQSFSIQLQELEKQEKSSYIDEKGVTALLEYCALMREGLRLMNFEERRKVLQLLQVKIIVYERKPLKAVLSGLLPSTEVTFNSSSWTPCHTKRYQFCLWILNPNLVSEVLELRLISIFDIH